MIDVPKLTYPTFNGIDPISWLSRTSQYFYLNDIARENKVHYIWWQWIQRVYHTVEGF